MREAADFLGDWSVARHITDRHAGQTGHFAGAARLEAIGADDLRYVEEGLIRLGDGPPLRARRVYLWRFAAGRVLVSFEDGREFHSFAAGTTGAGTDHPCGDDLYRVAYDFMHWPMWSARWDVTGPRKDYTLETIYRRC